MSSRSFGDNVLALRAVLQTVRALLAEDGQRRASLLAVAHTNDCRV